MPRRLCSKSSTRACARSGWIQTRTVRFCSMYFEIRDVANSSALSKPEAIRTKTFETVRQMIVKRSVRSPLILVLEVSVMIARRQAAAIARRSAIGRLPGMELTVAAIRPWTWVTVSQRSSGVCNESPARMGPAWATSRESAPVPCGKIGHPSDGAKA